MPGSRDCSTASPHSGQTPAHAALRRLYPHRAQARSVSTTFVAAASALPPSTSRIFTTMPEI